uniref:EGF-like domain-containing protein n=1 Tax=Cyclopterus lumpus TaxID=8103 RepID=A0A8C2ZY44_CYCLU
NITPTLPTTNITPTLAGEPTTNITPTLAGEPTTNITPTLAGESTTNITPTLAGEPTTNITPTLAGEPTTNITPTLAGEPTTNITPTLAGESTTNITPTLAGEPTTNITPTLAGEPTTTITPTIASETTTPVPTKPQGPCDGNPCKDGSACELRSNQTFVCLCLAGDDYDYLNRKCVIAKVFPGQLGLPDLPYETNMSFSDSPEFQEVSSKITILVSNTFSPLFIWLLLLVLYFKAFSGNATNCFCVFHIPHLLY